MTDIVSLNHRQSGGMYTDEAVPAFQPHSATLVAAMHSRSAVRYVAKARYFFASDTANGFLKNRIYGDSSNLYKI